MARSQPASPGTDALTGLLVRSMLEQVLREADERAQVSGGRVAVAVIDLRDLKAVNQMFGRDDGDRVVELVAARVRSQAADGDVALRLAGGEFAIVHVIDADGDEYDDVDDLAAGLITTLSGAFDVRSYTVHVGANIGIALFTPGDHAVPDRDDLASVMRRADVALYRAKLQGENRYEIYEHSMHGHVSPAVVVDWLHAALEGRQLRLAYQPIYSIGGEVLVAAEAFLRWQHPTEGLLLPEVVLPALEDSGLIVEVGEWIMHEACRQAAIWRDGNPGVPQPVVFLNVSPRQLMSPTFLRTLESALETHGIEPSQLCLELGALTALSPTSQVWMLLRECRALGVRLALSNFGNNDSSYGLIRRLQLDYVKLGRQLTSARHATRHDDAIAASILSLANALGFSTIAEGIEDPASLERARSLGCDSAQGFYFGTAEAGASIDQKLQSGRAVARVLFS